MALDLCSINTPNGGAAGCDKDRKIPRYIIVGSYEFTPSNYASPTAFIAALKAATLKSRNQSGKLIVLPIIQDVQNATEADAEGSLNQGFKETLREGAPAFKYGVKISNKQAQILRKLNGQDVYVFTIDSDKVAWGTLLSTGNFRGESAKLHISGDNFTDGQNSKVVTVGVSYLDAEEFKGSSAWFDLPSTFSPAQYGRLKDVDLAVVSAAANVISVGITLATGKVGTKLNIFDDYSAALAAAGNWICTNNQTGAPIVITGVAANAATKCWDVTLTSATFTALASGDKITLSLAAPSVLDAANVTGIEGVEVIYAKP